MRTKAAFLAIFIILQCVSIEYRHWEQKPKQQKGTQQQQVKQIDYFSALVPSIDKQQKVQAMEQKKQEKADQKTKLQEDKKIQQDQKKEKDLQQQEKNRKDQQKNSSQASVDNGQHVKPQRATTLSSQTKNSQRQLQDQIIDKQKINSEKTSQKQDQYYISPVPFKF